MIDCPMPRSERKPDDPKELRSNRLSPAVNRIKDMPRQICNNKA